MKLKLQISVHGGNHQHTVGLIGDITAIVIFDVGCTTPMECPEIRDCVGTEHDSIVLFRSKLITSHIIKTKSLDASLSTLVAAKGL